MIKNVGDKVIIKKDLNEKNGSDEFDVTVGMIDYAGVEAIITNSNKSGQYELNVDNGDYVWINEMFESKDKTDSIKKEEIPLTIKENELYFAKVKPNAIIPTKRDEDAGFDVFTCETETIVIPPLSMRMIDTGLAIACNQAYFPKFFDKGGMGSKGIVVSAGVGDSGYRDSYFVPLINTNKDKYLILTNQKQTEIDESEAFDLDTNMFMKFNSNMGFNFAKKSDCIIKPLKKSFAQFVMIPVPKLIAKEISYEELKSIKSDRGLGKLGSSGK